jgi:hypothetical protein
MECGYAFDADTYCERCIPKPLQGHPELYELDGESDIPEHCGKCRVPLESDLTPEGINYVFEHMVETLTQGPDKWNRVTSFPRVPKKYRTSTVVALVNNLKEAPDSTPILADALQDAGYGNEPEEARFLEVLRNGVPGGILDMDYLADGMLANKKCRSDHFMFCRHVEIVRSWAEMLGPYYYPGDDDMFMDNFLALTEPGVDVLAELQELMAIRTRVTTLSRGMSCITRSRTVRLLPMGISVCDQLYETGCSQPNSGVLIMADKKNYHEKAQDDAWEMADNFLDEIIEQAICGEVSDDYDNDYKNGDSYHHESHVDKSYTLLEAAELLDQLDRFEETDNGLWEGLDPREAVSCQAAYTYGSAVGHYWNEIIKEINEWVDSFEYDEDDENDRKDMVTRYITILVTLKCRFKDSDCDGMIAEVLKDIDKGEWNSTAVLCDWWDDHDEWDHLAKRFRELVGVKKEAA